MKQPNSTSLINVYLTELKEKRTALWEDSSSLDLAKPLRDEIKGGYLSDWNPFSGDISYLSHAMLYLIDSNSDTPRLRIPDSQLEEIRLMALAAQRTGGGHY
jgi:hypothetical protein